MAEPVSAYRVVMEGSALAVPLAKPLTLPNKPSVAVLPFTNMSGDPEQEYFADGLVEDLTTSLSKIRGSGFLGSTRPPAGTRHRYAHHLRNPVAGLLRGHGQGRDDDELQGVLYLGCLRDINRRRTRRCAIGDGVLILRRAGYAICAGPDLDSLTSALRRNLPVRELEELTMLSFQEKAQMSWIRWKYEIGLTTALLRIDAACLFFRQAGQPPSIHENIEQSRYVSQRVASAHRYMERRDLPPATFRSRLAQSPDLQPVRV